ncbi:MAG: alanine--tRNA ligase, partial [Gammaproteobacteria bacterium]
KREAIQFAWQFLTETLKIPQEKLWVTVFRDDDEAAAIWLDELKVDPARFTRCGEKDNFWSMGDTGPCGPCSEIFYDHGETVAGGPPGSPDQEGDRYVEIWNLVFMQYNRSAAGELSPLPQPSVDTGMGLERITAVMQGVHSNYETDLFQPLIKAVASLCLEKKHSETALKVIADHIRACAFLITEGIIPSNEGRGYVLRRIIRRAVRHGYQLGLNEPFFHCLAKPLADVMGMAYPQLVQQYDRIRTVLFQEEQQFKKTLEQGLKILQQDLSDLQTRQVPGETIFKLYDTYGFPVDLTADVAREQGLTLDLPGFEKAMQRQRSQSQTASQFGVDETKQIRVDQSTEFKGYTSLHHMAKVQVLLSDGETVKSLQPGEQGAVVLDCSPFYAEAGGQVGDSGQLIFPEGLFVVKDTKKSAQAHLHFGVVQQGILRVGDEIEAQVDIVRRQTIMLNHSATHLLHAALRQVLGEHVLQKGSLVAPDRLRFDFTHTAALTGDQIQSIEALVNAQIRANNLVRTDIMSPEQAKQAGALALFGEKYADHVRVLAMGEFSKELCGGTHVERTGDIGFFKIIASSGIASGVRRVEALTGEAAIVWQQRTQAQFTQAADLLKSEPAQLSAKLQQLLQKTRSLEKQMLALQTQQASSGIESLLTQAEEIAGINVLATRLQDVDAKSLRHSLDQLKNKLDPAVIVLVGINNETMNVIAGISKSCLDKVPPAPELVQTICGKGGGRADMAQGGGRVPNDLIQRLQALKLMVRQKIESN